MYIRREQVRRVRPRVGRGRNADRRRTRTRLTPPLRMFLAFVFLIVAVRIVRLFIEPMIAEANQTDQRAVNRRLKLPTKFSSSEDAKAAYEPMDIEILVTYSDTSGVVRVRTVKSSDLSASWVWQVPGEGTDDHTDFFTKLDDSFQPASRFKGGNVILTDKYSAGSETRQHLNKCTPITRLHQMLRQKRRERRPEELIQVDRETDSQMQEAAIKRSKEFNSYANGKYSISGKEKGNRKPDYALKLMRNHIIMAKVYTSIAKAKYETYLYTSLIKHSRNSLSAIGEATLDAELNPCAFDREKEIRDALSLAKDRLYDCNTVARKLRVMIQLEEGNIKAQSKRSTFLTQLATKAVPKEMHCLTLLLTSEYYLKGYQNKEFPFSPKLEDPSLYHHAIISDNVLATSVVVNSAVIHAKKPGKHVFHIVTDKANFAAMKMWFIVNPPAGATIQVENLDDFTWLNSYYCPIMRQLESPRMREYYFKAHEPSSIAAATNNLNYGNSKYLSPLNHLRFYLPDVYPKLDKILFLDDDTVVQKDLTPLWSIDLKGMVNGAVETCKKNYHTFDDYLNFSNPKISKNFDPKACGWAFGMNIFDLKEWRHHDITRIYRQWQSMNDDRTLWQLGTLPAGLIAFYNLTYPLDRKWHVLALGHNMGLKQKEIEKAAVIQYSGHYKPWLDIAITKYKSYWSKYVTFDSPYVRLCHLIRC